MSSPFCLRRALARSSRSGPKGETQLTPMPIDKRGFGELPRNSSLKPATRVKPLVPVSAPQVCGPVPGRIWNGFPVVLAVTGMMQSTSPPVDLDYNPYRGLEIAIWSCSATTAAGGLSAFYFHFKRATARDD